MGERLRPSSPRPGKARLGPASWLRRPEAFTRSYAFAVPRDLPDQAIPTSADVAQTVTYLDGLGRDIQVRQRMGGVGAAEAGANISQNLADYRVVKAVRLDGAGRLVASVEPYYSASGAYQDISASIDASAGQTLHATLFTFDAQGRQTCAVRRYLATSLPPAGSCVSSFAENGGHALATLSSYRGVTLGGKAHLAVKTIPPENNLGASPAGPESLFDAAGWLRRTTDVDGNASVVLYDRIGRKTGLQRVPVPNATTRPAQVSTSVTLDLMGRATATNDPNSGKRTIAYDPASPSLVQKITFTRTGDEVSYTYDKGRIATVKQCKAPIPTGPCTTDTLAYDAPYQATGYDFTAGRLSRMSNGATTVALGYDQNGAIVRRDQWFAWQAQAFSSVATVRNDGRPVQTSLLPPGLATYTQTSSYDSLGRSAGLASGATTHWAATNVPANTGAYDALDRLLGASADNARVTQAWSFGGGSGLLASQSVQTPGAANPLVYAVGGMTYRGTKLTGYTDAVSQTAYGYWYSAAGRLVAAKAAPTGANPLAQNSIACFSHNLTRKHEPGASYGNLERAVERLSGVVQDYGYSGTDLELGPGWAGPDAATSLSSPPAGGPETFEYDLLNRLVAVTRQNGQSEKLWYDPLGGIVTRQIGNAVISYVGNQATVTGALNAGCTTPSCGVTVTSVDAHLLVGGKRLGSVRLGASSRTVYLHRDRLESVVATTLAGGQAGASYRYSAYGALEVAQGDAGNAASEIGYAGSLRLTGGLLLMGARVYHPGLRTFLQTDPLEPFLYRYTSGDPINYVDPTGMEESPQLPGGACSDGGAVCQPGLYVSDEGRIFVVYEAGSRPDVSLVGDKLTVTWANGDWASMKVDTRASAGTPVDMRGRQGPVQGRAAGSGEREWGSVAVGVATGAAKAGSAAMRAEKFAKMWRSGTRPAAWAPRIQLAKPLSQTGLALGEWARNLQFSVTSEVLVPAAWGDVLVPIAAGVGVTIIATVLTHEMVEAANNTYSELAPAIYQVLSYGRE